jgi:hypothetical protein
VCGEPKEMSPMVRGVHPIAAASTKWNGSATTKNMNSTSLYPISPSQQAVLAAMVFSPQLLLTEKSSVTEQLGSPDEPAELIADFEDHRNHGIGE